MKKVLLLLALCFAVFPLSSQNRFSYNLEIAAGAGIGRGPQFILAPEFVVLYDLGAGLRAGVGTGLRIARPCFQYVIEKGAFPERNFGNELDIPLFLRLGYGQDRFFANLDTGYAIGTLFFLGPGWAGDGKMDPVFNGFFLEPQAGWKIGRRNALALGVLLQQSFVEDYIGAKAQKRKLFTPTVTLRYVHSF